MCTWLEMAPRSGRQLKGFNILWKEGEATVSSLFAWSTGLYSSLHDKSQATTTRPALPWEIKMAQSDLWTWDNAVVALAWRSPTVEIICWRCLKSKDFISVKSVQLHIVSDGSRVGYGAVDYLRFFNAGRIHCCFVMGKTRLAPIHEITIPRLELTQ